MSHLQKTARYACCRSALLLAVFLGGAPLAFAQQSAPPTPLGPEVAAFRDVDQFQKGHTAYACGFFAVAVCKAMRPTGQTCATPPADMAAEAEAWYQKYNGDNSHANKEGMSLDQLYQLLTQEGLPYRALDLDVGTVRDWAKRGYPVIVSCPETSIYDRELGDHTPFPWTPAGNHVITITGVGPNGDLLVRDTANIAAPNTLRPGPRLYDADKIQFISATLVAPPGKPLPSAGDVRQQLLGRSAAHPGARIGGWSSAQMSEQPVERDWDVTPAVTGPGRYSLLLDYEAGADALAVSDAVLLVNGRPVARDTHDGWTGVVAHGRVYHFTLAAYDPAAKYAVRVRLHSDGGTDSRGSLYFAEAP